MLGELEPREGRLDAHLARWERALALEPDSAAHRVDLAGILLRADRLDAALAELALAREGEPDFAPAHHASGVVALARDSVDEAVAHFERAAALDPFQPTTWTRLGDALARRNAPGDRERARQAWLRALAEDPDHAPARQALEAP